MTAEQVSRGGPRAFGLQPDGRTIRQDEADIIRECAGRILAGESLRSVAADLQAREVRTVTGKAFRAGTLRRVLGSPRISGRRELRLIDRCTGLPASHSEIIAEADWPAIISAADSDRLRAALAIPGPPAGLAVARTQLLGGILRCGLCGAGMVGSRKRGVRWYACMRVTGTRSCGRVITAAAPVEHWVGDAVLVALDSPQTRDRLIEHRRVDPVLPDSVSGGKRRRARLSGPPGCDEPGHGKWPTARAAVQARAPTSQARPQRVTGPDPLRSFVGDYHAMWSRWQQANISQRRAIVDAVVERIEVLRARGPGFDPQRFQIVWRG